MRYRKLHARVLSRRNKASRGFLLSEEDFRFATDCERMRIDRNGSTLSVLLIELPKPLTADENKGFFTRVLEGRLRITDTPGQLNDGRVAVLLPDTPEEGAWKVATDISEVFSPGPGRPKCEVLVYPDKGRRSKAKELDKSGSDRTAPGSSQESSEFFFAQSVPRGKRSIDILGSSVGLLASLPFLGLIAVAVKATSKGPVFYTQEREGHGGKRFRMYKIRTMNIDAEKQQSELRKHSNQDGPAFKMKRDPRTTTVGRFLRWTSMDELPQFFNVLKGDMSLVGPRPLPTMESRGCDGWHRRRLNVMPGMTCTWQVSERGNVPFDEWIRMDLQYAEKHSFWNDLKLMVITLPSLLLQKGMR